MTSHKPYPTNVSDEEWAFAAPYLTLMTEQAPQRKYDLRAMFNALRWMARAGAPWRLLPNDFPPWEAVCQQTQRWLQAGCFEAMVNGGARNDWLQTRFGSSIQATPSVQGQSLQFVSCESEPQ